MAVIDVSLEVIDDNPYNPRKHYPQAKVKEMAQSLQEVGLRQVPEGRHVDGRVQLAYGHMRKRGFGYNLQHDPYPENEKWKRLPVDVKEISDQDMFHFSMEENLRRSEITPIEVARCIEAFSEMFPDVTEKALGEKHGMTEANVSNMKRVLRLPEKFLEKIDQGVMSFTQGRELLTLEGLENAENLMASALGGLRTGNKGYGHANTVDGLQVSIHEVIGNHYRPLDKQWEGYRWDILFDTRAAGCLKCDKMIRTHPNKSEGAHYCTDEECWDRHDKEHREKAAAAAKAKMEAEVLERAAKDVAQRTPEPAPPPEYKLEKRGSSWIALDGQGRIIAINHNKEVAEEIAKASFEPVLTILNPLTEEYRLNHTYRISRKFELRKAGDIFDVTAQDLTTAVKALGVKAEDIEAFRVFKSSGKLGTGGDVSAGWSKCTETLGDFSQEKSVEARADERGQQMEEAQERANLERPVGELPCDTCLKGKTCERTFFHFAYDNSGRLICEQWECDHVSWATRPATPTDVPEDILTLAREKAGSRAEVLDLNEICSGDRYYRQVKSGYAELTGELRHVDDPAECLEHCTQGFHYAFDSKAKEQKVIPVCSNTKCLAKKKGAFTRKVNAAGQALKKAETKAIKEAIAQVSTIGRGQMKLILLTQIKGKHVASSYYGGEGVKGPEKWLWDKVSAGTADLDRDTESLFKKIEKLDDVALAQLVVEFMLYYLLDHGDVGSYEIKTELPLSWLGVKIELEPEKEEAVAEVGS